MTTNFQFINSGLIPVTSSFTIAPTVYPLFTGSILVTGGELTGSSVGYTPPVSLSLYPNTYSINNPNEASNQWLIIVDNYGNLSSSYSGSVLSSSTLVSFGTVEDSNVTLRPNTRIDVWPYQFRNVLYEANNTTSFVTQDRMTFYTNASGSLSMSLVSPWVYGVEIFGNVRNTSLYFLATGSSEFVGNWIVAPVSNTNAQPNIINTTQFAYDRVTSDLRYLGTNLSASFASSSLSSSYSSTSSYAQQSLSSSFANVASSSLSSLTASYLGIGGSSASVQFVEPGNDIMMTNGVSSSINLTNANVAVISSPTIELISQKATGTSIIIEDSLGDEITIGQTRVAVIGQLDNALILNNTFGSVALVDASQNGIFLNGSGSVGIGVTNPTNSLDVQGNISASVVTASLFFGTASLATTASFSQHSLTSSFASSVVSSSFATTANTALNLNNTFVHTGNGLTISDADGSSMGITGGGIDIIYNFASSVPPFVLNNVTDNAVMSINGSGSIFTTGSVSGSTAHFNSITASLLLGTASYSPTASYVIMPNGGKMFGSTVNQEVLIVQGDAVVAINVTESNGGVTLSSNNYTPYFQMTDQSSPNMGVLQLGDVGDNNNGTVITLTDFSNSVAINGIVGILTSTPSASYALDVNGFIGNSNSRFAKGVINPSGVCYDSNAMLSIDWNNRTLSNGNGGWFVNGTSSYANTASYVQSSSYATTASFALNAGGSGGTTLFTGSTYPITSSWAVTSSFSQQSLSASYAPPVTTVASASWASSSLSSSFATKAITAVTASYVSGSPIITNLIETIANENLVINCGTGSITITGSTAAISASLGNLSFYTPDAIEFYPGFAGIFNVSGQFVYGTDLFFQLSPSSTTNNAVFEAYDAQDLIIGTGGNSDPIIFAINRNECAAIGSGSNGFYLNVTGSVIATSHTGSLFGTASYASTLFGTAPAVAQNYIVTGSYTNTQTSNYNLQASDNGKLILMNSSTNTWITASTSLPQGFACSIMQEGSGQVSVIGGSGVTINTRQSGFSSSYAQYAVITLMQYAANTYVLAGDLNT